jgi:hypothetical protein
VRLIARLSGCLCVLAIGAVGLSPASAGAVTLGSTNLDPAQTDFGQGCGSASCVWMQKRLPGATVRAPFSGDIHKWRVVSAGPEDYQLVVMHKKRNGKFKNVFESSIGSATGPGAFVFPVPSPLPIHKGDYIGIKSDGAHGMQGIDNPDAKGLTFDPAVDFPDARKPSFSSASEYQYNATLKRH